MIMNDRLNVQNLIDLLAEKHGMNKQEADEFVKEFFLLIEEALENDRCVKIKNLGTFKLIDVDSRESIKVNTGERFQIEGHTKVSFTPDSALRDMINKPFAHFETVILNENTVLDDTPMDETEEEAEEMAESADISVTENLRDEEIIDEESVIEEPVIEESVVEESVVEEPVVEESVIEEPVVEEPVVEEPVVEEPVIEEVMTEEAVPEEAATGVVSESVIKEPIVEELVAEEVEAVAEDPSLDIPSDTDPVLETPCTLTAEEIIAAELQNSDTEFKRTLPEEAQPVTMPPVSAAQKSPIPYLVTIIILVLLLCGSALVFIYYPDLFSPVNKKDRVEVPAPQSQLPIVSEPEVLLDTIVAVKDTVAEVVVKEPKEVTPQPIKKVAEPVRTNTKASTSKVTPVKPDSVNYKITGTKTTHTVSEGETLTRISLRFYGTKDLWPYIVQHNRNIIKNPDNVPYGTTLKIPELTKR